MEQNIYRVINESQIDEILEDNKQKLVVLMYSAKTCGPCKLFKPKFVALANQHKDVLFIYIDRLQFTIGANKYFKKYESTPTFLYYFGNQELAYVVGVHETSIVSTIFTIKQKIEERRQEMMQREKLLEEQQRHETQKIQLQEKPMNPSQELMAKKMDMLNRLRDFQQQGAKLTKNYTLESSYDDMVYEYQFHTDPQFRQQVLQEQSDHQNSFTSSPKMNEQQPQESEIVRKQEQVKTIQELGALHQMMQMQNLNKLQQMRNFQRMKEQQERNELERKDK